MPRFCFQPVYGIRLAADTRIPGLLEAPGATPADVQVWLQELPPELARLLAAPGTLRYLSPEKAYSGDHVLQVWNVDGGFRFRYADGTEFAVGPGAHQVGARWPGSATLEDAATYLLGPVLGFVLRLRGFVCLHASAVVVGESAIVLMGPPGAGKSTAAAALALQGLPVLADDVVALEPHAASFRVHPGYPRLNLWPDSVQALFGGHDRLPLITRGWEKRFLPLGSDRERFQDVPAALRVIYLLAEAGDAVRFAIEPVGARAALMAIVANTYANYLLDGPMRSAEFRAAGDVAARVPLRRLRVPRDLAALRRLPALIVDDCVESSMPA